MLALLDVKTQNILLYGEDGIVKIPFTKAGSITEYTGEDKITYITNAIKVSYKDIINLINSMGIKSQVPLEEDNGNKYLCGTIEGMIYINENLKFEGKYDCKLIDENMRNTINENNLLQNLIKNKKIKVIGESEKNRLLRGLRKFKKDMLERHSKKDDSLDRIIMNTRVSDWDGSVSEEDKHNDIIEIDLEKKGKIQVGGGRGVETMSELDEMMEEK